MAAPTIYRSDDGSAPVIDGTASALRLALNAILVDGYGAKAAAGWSKAYEDAGNHLVVYQNAGHGRYLRLDDSATRLAEFRGYRSMSDVNTGVGPFPGVNVTTCNCRKSVSADSTARPWICLANERHFYLIIFGNQTTIGSFDGGDGHFAYGELDSSIPGDTFNSFLQGSFDTSLTSTTATTARQAFNFNSSSITFSSSCYAEGSFAQAPLSSTIVVPLANTPFSGNSGEATFPSYPDPSTGKLLIARKMARMTHGGSTTVVNRGYMPGLWLLCHPEADVTTFDTFSGSGTLAGRTFLIVKTGAGAVVFETTDGSW
ncbi:tail assembly protein [Caudoviricetes sp.]|nr:tail assembly protein [Caudoviricetes sp.]